MDGSGWTGRVKGGQVPLDYFKTAYKTHAILYFSLQFVYTLAIYLQARVKSTQISEDPNAGPNWSREAHLERKKSRTGLLPHD